MIVILGATGIFEYLFLSLKTTFGANNYIENIVWYRDTSDNEYKINFSVKTTFDVYLYEEGNYCAFYKPSPESRFNFTLYDNSGSSFALNRTCPGETGNSYTFTAGTTHTLILHGQKAKSFNSSHYIKKIQYIYGGSIIFTDTEEYYFTEYPSLSLDYPEDEIEIAGDFQITGTLTMPSPYTDYNYIASAVYFENPWSSEPIDFIGNFYTSLTATSSQEFAIDVISLPITYPDKIKIRMELWNMENDIITDTFSGNEYPWLIDIYTRHIGEAPEYPFYPPIWSEYLNISRPSASSDGYYRIQTPTSSVDFIHNFPETYTIYIKQEGIMKMATTTFSNINIENERKFILDDVDASTSTIKWIEAIVYNIDDED